MNKREKQLVEAARKIVEIQIMLTEGMLRTWPVSKVDEFVFRAPSEGTVEIPGSVWRFVKHGLGFTFIDEATKEKIEMHDHFGEPNTVDAWRLGRYLESQTGMEEEHKMVSSELQMLAKTSSTGIRAVDATHYQVAT